ncbi:MAG: regulatory signaling modulator protein AmpE [Gammaproteobacteria bacterium]
MNFLALLLGLATERMLTHLFHLREFRWLDPLFDRHLRRLRKARSLVAVSLTLLLTVLLVAPVAAASLLLWDELLRIPYFLFAVVVLLFSLGPRDLDDEVEDYLAALESGDADTQRQVAQELLERSPPETPIACNEAVERAIYTQANNRIFGVVFWFLLLGPTGAWAFRVVDLMRHRVEVRAAGKGAGDTMVGEAPAAMGEAVRTLHGVLAWIPSRLLMLGYVLAGNFEDAMSGWRNGGHATSLPFAENSNEILARVGMAASGRSILDVGNSTEALERIRGARSLVMRTLWMIWCPVIAVLTLYDWLI